MVNPIVLNEDKNTYKDLILLKKENKIWDFIDIYEKQLAELFEINNPQLLSTSSEYKKKLKEFVNPRIRGTDKLNGNWIYYPWNGLLIHAVSEEEYFNLRTNRNKNLITKDEQESLYNSCVGIIGLSVGSGIALGLAYQGIAKNMKLAEFDTLETTNLNRTQAKMHDVGDLKLNVVEKQLYEINPYQYLKIYQKGINKENLDDFINKSPKPDAIFEIIDDFEMKIQVRIVARKAGIPVIGPANLGDRILLDIERYDLDRGRPLLNGVLGDLPEKILKNPNEDKNKYAVQMVGIENIPQRAIDSVKEIEKTLVGRPQLSSTVAMSAAFCSYIARNIILGNGISSKRVLIDLEKILKTEKGQRSNYEAWNVSLNAFPKKSSLEEKLKYFAKFGILAANIHNTQPWRFEMNGNTMSILPDLKHQLKIADPTCKNLYISLGCCVANIESVAGHFGYTVTQNLKRVFNGKPVVSLVFERNSADKKLSNLAPFIIKRYSNKLPYDSRPVSREIVRALVNTGKSNVKILFTDDKEEIFRIAELQKEAIKSMASNGEFRKELVQWLRPNDTKRCDGMPGFVVGFNQPESQIGKIIIAASPRSFEGMAEKDQELIETSPLVGIIANKGKDENDWLEIGKVYETLSLKAMSLGLSITPHHAVIESEYTNGKLSREFNLKNIHPQLLFRVGYDRNVTYHTPRRSIEKAIYRDTEAILAQALQTDVKIQQIKIKDYQVNYLSAGRGKPMVLIHGGNLGWGQWYPNIGALSKHFQLYAIDLPGGGRSTRVDFEKIDFQKDLVSVVETFILSLGIKRPYIVGASVGGWISAQIAIRKKVPIQKVVLADALGFSTFMQPQQKILSDPRVSKRMIKHILKPSKSNKNLEMFLRSVFANPTLDLRKEFIDYFYETSETSHNLLFISRLTRSAKELFLRKKLSSINSPTMVVWGEEDQLIPFDKNEKNVYKIPNVKIRLIKNAGHIPSIEKSREFNKIVINFLKQIPH